MTALLFTPQTKHNITDNSFLYQINAAFYVKLLIQIYNPAE